VSRCARCGTPLGVRVGIMVGGELFCNYECAQDLEGERERAPLPVMERKMNPDDRYPRCVQCDKPLGVHAGIKREGVRVCNRDCEYLYFGPPDPYTETMIMDFSFRTALEDLKKQNPEVDEAGILALYYLGWVKVPSRGAGDYDIYEKVRGWCEVE